MSSDKAINIMMDAYPNPLEVFTINSKPLKPDFTQQS